MEIEEEKSTAQPHLINDEMKWSIVHLKKRGNSNKETARLIEQYHGRSIGHQTVKRIWTNYEETGSVLNRWNPHGRPRTIDDEDLERLREHCREDRVMSTKERKQELDLEAGLSTINRALVDSGLKAYKARKKSPLSDENIESRLRFAEDHEDWENEDWNRVIFTDESSFRLVNSNGRVFIRRTEEEWEEDVFQAHNTHSRSVMVWGAISIDGTGPLIRVEGNIDATGYIDIFRYRLKRHYPGLYEGELIFQHDNAPVHTAYIVDQWFRSKNITVMDWPSKSPDLNIIEHVWGRLKYELRNTVFNDTEELWEEICRLWDTLITQDFIRNLYRSLPRRMMAVLQANGGHTKY